MKEKELLTLKQARVLADLTQDQVAEALGISRNMVSQYENGHCSPTVETAKAMCELYGCTVYDVQFPIWKKPGIKKGE